MLTLSAWQRLIFRRITFLTQRPLNRLLDIFARDTFAIGPVGEPGR